VSKDGGKKPTHPSEEKSHKRRVLPKDVPAFAITRVSLPELSNHFLERFNAPPQGVTLPPQILNIPS
jgi:hypothetical protein